MKRGVVYLITVVSLFLYFCAPYGDYWTFNTLTAILFVIEAFIVCESEFKSKLYVGFNILFSISFFLTSFAFAVLVKGTLAEVFNSILDRLVDFSYLPKCTSLCLVSYSFYAIGFLNYSKNHRVNSHVSRIDFSINKTQFPHFVFFIAFMLLAIQTLHYINTVGDINMSESPFLVSIFESLLPVTFVFTLSCKPCTNVNDFFKKNIFLFSLVSFMMLMYLYMGDRGLVIYCGITIIVVYVLFIKRIKWHTMLIMGIVGVLMMFVIRMTRGGDESLSSGSISSFNNAAGSALAQERGVMYYFSDLTGAVNELCVGYEYKKKHGLLEPIDQLALLPLYPFPLLPTIYTDLLYEKEPADFGTGETLNKYASDLGSANFGNHVVIDIYMKWGLIGILIVFFLFGTIVSFLYYYKDVSIYYASIYILFSGFAIYTPRNTIDFLIRPAAYIIFFTWIFLYSQKSVKIKKG